MQKIIPAGLIAASLCLAAAPGNAGDMEFKPFLSLGAEFNDNIFETVTNKRSEYITHVRPGLTSKYQAPFWTWDAVYSFDYRRYERNSHSNEYNHDAGLNGTIKLVENLLHVDLSDTYHRVSTDITRDATYQNSLFLNQTDQNIAMISPYLMFRPGQKTTIKTGYRYTDVRYWGEGIEKRDHAGFAELSHELSDKLTLSVNYLYDAVDTDSSYTKHDASAGFRYAFGETSSLFAHMGYSWQFFATGRNTSYPIWSIGLTHGLGIAVLTLGTTVQLAEDPRGTSTRSISYSARLDRAFKRGAASLFTNYSEYSDTETTGTSSDRQVMTLGANGNYEITKGLSVVLGGICDHYTESRKPEHDYRLTGTAGTSYAFNYDITLGLNYSYVSYLGGTSGDYAVNRVVLDLRKTF